MNSSATLTFDDTTKFMQPPTRMSGIFSTPMQNGNIAAVNTQTVVKKRARQQTVTVDNNNQTSKEIAAIFAQVQQMEGVENPMEELQRQMLKLFAQKESEWAFKLTEQKEAENEELACCKLKLKAAQLLLIKMDEFTKHLNNKAQQLFKNDSNGGQHFVDGFNGLTTPQSMRTFSPDLVAELTKERDSLRDEFGQLENSYSDLFKRYEKMRENCVLLKNSEEELKNLLEEENTKYERLLGRYQELRDSAAAQLNEANMEIQRIIKQHEENTLGLRCRLKMNENELKTLNMTIEGKNTQIDELNKMVQELMKNELMDSDEEEEGGLDDD